MRKYPLSTLHDWEEGWETKKFLSSGDRGNSARAYDTPSFDLCWKKQKDIDGLVGDRWVYICAKRNAKWGHTRNEQR